MSRRFFVPVPECAAALAGAPSTRRHTLYSVALYKLTGDRQHRETGLAAAQALYQRFNAKAGFIRA